MLWTSTCSDEEMRQRPAGSSGGGDDAGGGGRTKSIYIYIYITYRFDTDSIHTHILHASEFNGHIRIPDIF